MPQSHLVSMLWPLGTRAGNGADIGNIIPGEMSALLVQIDHVDVEARIAGWHTI